MIFSILIRLLGNVLTLYLLDLALPNLAIGGGWMGLLIAGIVLGLVNLLIKPLLKILTFPLKVVTLGLFTIVINLIVIYLVALLINSLQLADVTLVFSGWVDYIITAIVFSLINGIIHSLEKGVK